ncbi:hypothetical protein ['Paenibacillus yunnanensis' Narsing Rao et al. 2020]|nr:hypothetical protein [Paenibacillus tengchongensis]
MSAKLFNKLYSEYLVIPRPLRLLMLWGWIALFFYAGYRLGWFYWSER